MNENFCVAPTTHYPRQLHFLQVNSTFLVHIMDRCALSFSCKKIVNSWGKMDTDQVIWILIQAIMEGVSSPRTCFWMEGASRSACEKTGWMGDNILAIFGKNSLHSLPSNYSSYPFYMQNHLLLPRALLSHPMGHPLHVQALTQGEGKWGSSGLFRYPLHLKIYELKK